MGKRREKDQKPQLVLPNYPYKGKIPPEQVQDALKRKDNLVEAMIDAVGPDGTLINIPMDMLHILGFHLAYAGADVFEDLALIESREVENPANDNEHGLLWEGLREWRVKGEFGRSEDEPDDAEVLSEARRVHSELAKQSTPELRAALAEIFAAEAAEAADRNSVSQQERAAGLLRENDIRNLNKEGS